MKYSIPKPMPDLSDQARVDVSLLDAAMRAAVAGDLRKSLAVWRGAIMSGKTRDLGFARRERCHRIIEGAQKFASIKAGLAKASPSNPDLPFGELPMFPPGMTEKTRRFGAR